jgi:ATP-dependent DNA helicase RecG
MAIENSERFGLAQLYQFRGRIGRGQHASFCFLLTTGHEHTNNKRLQAIVAARNGFELAEMDLQQRGPGQFIGREQSGVPDIVMRSLQDGQLISLSKKAAQAIIEKDLSLKKYPLLKARLAAFQEELRRG